MSETTGNIEITKTIKGNLPRLPLIDIKRDVLGDRYSLSVVFVGDKLSKQLNSKYRNKTYIPNVLSFPYDKQNGEIYINPHQAARECSQYHLNKNDFIVYLFIHALFHLKGMSHGSRMENKEREVRKKFGLHK